MGFAVFQDCIFMFFRSVSSYWTVLFFAFFRIFIHQSVCSCYFAWVSCIILHNLCIFWLFTSRSDFYYIFCCISQAFYVFLCIFTSERPTLPPCARLRIHMQANEHYSAGCVGNLWHRSWLFKATHRKILILYKEGIILNKLIQKCLVRQLRFSRIHVKDFPSPFCIYILFHFPFSVNR